MLIYANRLPLRVSRGLLEPLEPIADWLSRKLKRELPAARLLANYQATGNGARVRANAALTQHPHYVAIELTHPDRTVSGRQWQVEIGLRQDEPGADVVVSILVRTSEVSARVTAPVQPSAPTVVAQLLQRCQIASTAVGGAARILDDQDAEGFRYVVLDSSRAYPLVVVSAQPDGTYVVDQDQLIRNLIGIAEVVVIPPGANTFWLARAVGDEFVPYRGAVKIIFPLRPDGSSDVRTVLPAALAQGEADPRKAASEVFSQTLHRTNLRLSWQHTSTREVQSVIANRSIEEKRAEAAASGDLKEYVSLLEGALAEQESATKTEAGLRIVSDTRADEAERARDAAERKATALQHQLEQQSHSRDESPYGDDELANVAAAVLASVTGEPTPVQSLLIIEHFFGERIRILPDAWASAKASEGFRHGGRLYGLLHKLATDYWMAIKQGKPDRVAGQCFGNSYASKESETTAGRKGASKRRTFKVDGIDVMMEKHLKIGVKDSTAETIRVHFEWFSETRCIVIGHCGAHIPFA